MVQFRPSKKKTRNRSGEKCTDTLKNFSENVFFDNFNNLLLLFFSLAIDTIDRDHVLEKCRILFETFN